MQLTLKNSQTYVVVDGGSNYSGNYDIVNAQLNFQYKQEVKNESILSLASF